MLGTAIAFAVWPPQASDDRGTAAFTGFFLAGIAILLFLALVKNLVRLLRLAVVSVASRRARKRLQAIDDSITDEAKKERVDPAEVAGRVRRKHGIRSGSPEEKLVADRVARYFTHESALQAQAEFVHFLPRIPRSAKRLMNHLRLRLYVAVRRELLGSGSELTPRHLGKWVVLEERWPELARRVSEQPHRLGQLERAQDLTGLESSLATFDSADEASESLLEFVKTEPKLGLLAEQLIFLEPARDPLTSSAGRRPA